MYDWEEDAIQQVIDATPKIILKTRNELIAHFKKTYPGKKLLKNGKTLERWRPELAKAVQPFTHSKTGEPQKLTSVERRFQTGRELKGVSEKQRAEYEALGKKLGPVGRRAPMNGYHVHYDGKIKFSECEDRPFDIDIVGKMAEDLAQNPEKIVNIMMRVWLHQEGEEKPSSGPCEEEGEPSVTITANPDDKKIVEPKRHKPAVPFKKRKPVPA